MASPTGTGVAERPASPPHLVSLVLQSKKGLQHGEQLCSRAHDLAHASAREAVDVLALDAKMRWLAAGVAQQLKTAAGVAQGIGEQRARLEEEAKVWDRARAQHQDALDATLEALGAQPVPPSFHESPLASALFGIADDDGEEAARDAGADRSRWKTLRDFVDERGIEDVLDAVEDARGALDDARAAAAAHPAALAAAVAQIRGAAAGDGGGGGARDVGALRAAQERATGAMAAHLESLAAHYGQMATALKEKEAGETLADEDMAVFVRDTAELPSIIAELEEGIAGVEAVYREIAGAKSGLQAALAGQGRVLDSLDALGDRMDAVLREQAGIELETQATYETLNDYLETLATLRATYETYEMSYHALVLEMERRRRYRDGVRAVAEDMRARLARLRDDEIAARETFYAAHAAAIPEDLCLAISNVPQTYAVGAGGEEVLPEVGADMLAEARRRVEAAGDALVRRAREDSV